MKGLPIVFGCVVWSDASASGAMIITPPQHVSSVCPGPVFLLFRYRTSAPRRTRCMIEPWDAAGPRSIVRQSETVCLSSVRAFSAKRQATALTQLDQRMGLTAPAHRTVARPRTDRTIPPHPRDPTGRTQQNLHIDTPTPFAGGGNR